MGRSKPRKKATPPAPRQDLKHREIDAEALHAHLERGRAAMGEEGYLELRMVVDTMAFLSKEVAVEGMTIDGLRHVLFGPRTESTAAVCKKPVAPRMKHPDDPKAKGHGRKGSKDYPGADRVKTALEGVQSGDPCPECPNGKLYEQAEPATLIRVTGVSPFRATIYEQTRWRCNLCDYILTAPVPAGVGPDKYDESVAALLGLLRYGVGLPHTRIAALQACFGIPLAVSTQWEIVLEAAGLLLPVHAELMRQAAQGKVLHNDDTPMRILNRKSFEKEGRKAIQTTAILSDLGANRIALFITGQNHAGENLGAILEHRAVDLAQPIQMCDALAANMVGDAGALNTILAHCLVHARRKFVEVETKFPDDVRYLLESLKVVYRNDALAKAESMDPATRLALHQEGSAPVMKELEEWLRIQFEEHKVEPNSGLGKAIKYMRKHWKELTLFLRQPGAPLDNSAAERVVKRAIMHRKNSLYYRTQQGARVGDTFMSLIHTAELNGVSAYDYLLALLRHAGEVEAKPGDWMPWNYQSAIQAIPA
jgi:transposase